MNTLHISGNLTKDAELRTTGSGKSVLGFTVANNQGFGDKQHTEYYSCNIWGERGEKLAQYLQKGTKVFVHGEHRTNKREHNGKTYFDNTVFVKEIEFGGSGGSGVGKPKPVAQSGGAEFDDRDVPF